MNHPFPLLSFHTSRGIKKKKQAQAPCYIPVCLFNLFMLMARSGISNLCVIPASSRLMEHLRDRPQHSRSSHTRHFPLFIALHKRYHTHFLLAVLMNQQRAAKEWPSGRSGKNQVPAVKIFLGDLPPFYVSLYPGGGTGQKGAFMYLHFTGQAAKKKGDVVMQEQEREFLSF